MNVFYCGCFFFSSRRRHTRCALVTGVQTCALPISAHLTINLCWLWFVLRRRWWADAAALTLGFFAVGLHQFHYHPLFAAPILFLLLLRKDWGRAAFYALGYLDRKSTRLNSSH